MFRENFDSLLKPYKDLDTPTEDRSSEIDNGNPERGAELNELFKQEYTSDSDNK